MEKNRRTVSFLTLGCRVNQYETEAIMGEMSRRGFTEVPFGTPADVSVINTCTVTAESDRKSRQMIRRAVKVNCGKPVIVTGCYTETGRQEIEKIEGVTFVKGNAKKSEIPDIAVRLAEGQTDNTTVEIEDIMSAPYDRLSLSEAARARSYIKIEDGCDNKCAYCIIPKARGRVRSKPAEDVVEETKLLLSRGCREITLTGIEVDAYGRDTELGREEYMGERLASLAEKVSEAGCNRLSLGSLDPAIMSDRFVERMAAIRSLMPHCHLSVQSGSSGVLARMRRRYNGDMLRAAVKRLKDNIPDIMLSADIITGFPGETEKEFEETVEFVKQTHFLHLHIFPYSERRGTPAAEMENSVPVHIRNERLKKLNEAQAEIKRQLLLEYIEKHGEDSPVYLLVEEIKNGKAVGHSEHYADVEIGACGVNIGDIIPVKLTSTDGEICYGEKMPVKE